MAVMDHCFIPTRPQGNHQYGREKVKVSERVDVSMDKMSANFFCR